MFVNCSSSPDFFISERAHWERRDYGESNLPNVPDRNGRMVEVDVYSVPHDSDGPAREGPQASMLFPIHEACQAIVYRLCTIRQLQQRQSRDGTLSKPDTVEKFCDAFAECRRRNLETPGFTTGYDGGLEWPHQAYGVTRYWSDGWHCE